MHDNGGKMERGAYVSIFQVDFSLSSGGMGFDAELCRTIFCKQKKVLTFRPNSVRLDIERFSVLNF